jgi:hypothetical protein
LHTTPKKAVEQGVVAGVAGTAGVATINRDG